MPEDPMTHTANLLAADLKAADARFDAARGMMDAACDLLNAAIARDRSDVMVYRANYNRFQSEYEWAVRDLAKVKARIRWEEEHPDRSTVAK